MSAPMLILTRQELLGYNGSLQVAREVVPNVEGGNQAIYFSLSDADGLVRFIANDLTLEVTRGSDGKSYSTFDGQFGTVPAQNPTLEEITTTGIYQCTLPAGGWGLDSYITSVTYAPTGQVWIRSFEVAEPGAGMGSDIQAIRAKLGTIGSGIIHIVTPVVSGSDIKIVAGDDYVAADGRAIILHSDTWPDLSGATVTVSGSSTDKQDTTLIASQPVSIVRPTTTGDGEAQVSFDLPASITSTLPVGRDSVFISVRATLSGGSVVTLARGFIDVEASP